MYMGTPGVPGGGPGAPESPGSWGGAPGVLGRGPWRLEPFGPGGVSWDPVPLGGNKFFWKGKKKNHFFYSWDLEEPSGIIFIHFGASYKNRFLSCS